MDAKIPSFNSEVLILDEQIIHIKTKFLPAMVKKKKSVQLLNMPIGKGDLICRVNKTITQPDKSYF